MFNEFLVIKLTYVYANFRLESYTYICTYIHSIINCKSYFFAEKGWYEDSDDGEKSTKKSGVNMNLRSLLLEVQRGLQFSITLHNHSSEDHTPRNHRKKCMNESTNQIYTSLKIVHNVFEYKCRVFSILN